MARMVPILRNLSTAVVLAAVAMGPATVAEEPDEPSAPWMGVFLGDAVDGGVQIVALVPGGPAQAGGLQRGDVLVRVGGLAMQKTLSPAPGSP